MITLLLIYNIMHFLGDYTHLSTKNMLTAKAKGYPYLPILGHAGVHAFLIFMATLLYTKDIWMSLLIGIYQLITHFLIDTLKGRMNVWIPTLANPMNKFHWYVFGLDQLLHQTILITSVYFINL